MQRGEGISRKARKVRRGSRKGAKEFRAELAEYAKVQTKGMKEFRAKHAKYAEVHAKLAKFLKEFHAELAKHAE
jgi:hypothetical protein